MSQPPDRAATILARFNAAQNSLAAKLRDLPARAAEEQPAPDAWSAAQIGWHVATVNEYFAGVLMGSRPGAQLAPPGFKEGFDPNSLPDKLETPAALQPPAIVGRDSALEKLRASGQQLSKAIASLTPERGLGYTYSLSPSAVMSLYEAADFAGRHITRHVAQIERSVAKV
jgi:hypothetical protein